MLRLNSLALILILSLSACARAQKKSSSDQNQHESEAPVVQKENLEDPDLQTQINQMSTRLQKMETELSALNQKVTSTQVSIGHYQETKKSSGTGIKPHPVNTRGQKVNPKVSSSEVISKSGFSEGEAIQSYRDALLLFKAEKYSEAVLMFNQFKKEHSDHVLTGSAQYYIAESYFQQKEYRLSLEEFQYVLSAYPRSTHVSESLKRVSQIQTSLKSPADAAKSRQLLLSLFPNSPAAEEVMSEVMSDPAQEVEENELSTAQDLRSPQSLKKRHSQKAAMMFDEPPPTAPIPPSHTPPTSNVGEDFE